MSVKKLLVLSAAATLAAIGATVAIAGGPDHMAMPAEPVFQNSVYVDLHLGYAQSNWTDFNSNNVAGASASSWFAPTSRGKGGFSGGADLGYNITQHIAVEGGWFYLPKVNVAGTGTSLSSTSFASTVTGSVKSWFAYAAAKLIVPVMEHLDLYGKVGAGYRALTYTKSSSASAILNSVTGKGHYWAPVFGAGIQYTWGSWLLGAQYMHVPGHSRVNYAVPAFGAPNAAPSVNLYTGFLGYRFDI